MIDKLIHQIIDKHNPSVIGLDTSFDYLPKELSELCNDLEDVSKVITEFNCKIIDKVYKIVPAVKIQIAFYEMYGYYGIKAFYNTVNYAKEKGLIVIADVKRGDIGSTAACYAKAYLGNTTIGDKQFKAFDCDFVTINGYLGEDGITPFIEECQKNDRGVFVLVKTSNPSSGTLQDRILATKETIYEKMGYLVSCMGKELIGEFGYSDIGAVVGATYPYQAERLRKKFPDTFFLVPGYGAQGATAEDLSVCFDNRGLGAIVNSSRGIICAYRQPSYHNSDFASAAYEAACRMRDDITDTLKKKDKSL